MTTTNILAKSAKIARAYYTKASIFTGYEDFGQNPTEALLDSDGVWQQLRMESSVSQIMLTEEPFQIPQSSSEILEDYPVKGLQKPELTIEQHHTVEFVTRHEELLKAGFGTKIACTGDTTISTVTNTSKIIVASGTGFAAGNMIKITSAAGILKGFVEISSIETTTTLNLKNPVIGMIATDKVVGVTSWNTRITETDEYFHLFIETSLGNFFIYWCKPTISLNTELNMLGKLITKFEGSKYIKTTKAASDLSITTDVLASIPTVFNFKKVSIGDDVCRSITTSNFQIARTSTRVPSQCSDDMQGTGAVFNQPATAKVDVSLMKWSDNFTNYENGTQIKVLAYNEKIAISGDGVIENITKFNEVDAQIRPSLSIKLNSIEGKPLKVVL